PLAPCSLVCAYTTLFRSPPDRDDPSLRPGRRYGVVGRAVVVPHRVAGGGAVCRRPAESDRRLANRPGPGRGGVVLVLPGRATGRDRKSTRLNSSHVKISY